MKTIMLLSSGNSDANTIRKADEVNESPNLHRADQDTEGFRDDEAAATQEVEIREEDEEVDEAAKANQA